MDKIDEHPCYSKDASHNYARMHLAVAPKCNIQCNFCNRKYDCVNESRPGVSSRLLKPEEAVQKVINVAEKIPNLSTVGIAGPGDPLANPVNTFRTFELIKEKLPNIKPCLSTNGLAVLDYIEHIKLFEIDHVTITINMVDPEIGQKIYPWIRFGNEIYKGLEAAKILHERQIEGVKALVSNNILCKVNSVIIPGVNDQHLVDVSKTIKTLGAFLHNITPLIPCEGSHYGDIGIRKPTKEEVNNIQNLCGVNMKLMRHCRQCRADAVGMLGNDRSREFFREQYINPEKKVLAAVTTKGGGIVDQHFGHANEFQIYEVHGDKVRFIESRKTDRYCEGTETCGDDKTPLSQAKRILSDCAFIVTVRIGNEPKRELEKAGIKVYETWDVIEDAVLSTYRKHMQS